MRTVHWLFAISAALFIAGIGFIIAAGRMRETTPAATTAAPVVATKPVASVKQIMSAITGPTAAAVFEAVSTTVTTKGIEEVAPKDDAEWNALEAKAAALAESGNMLMTGDRAIDRGDWMKMSQALVDAGVAAVKAAQEKKPDAVLEVGERVNTSCDNCHLKYQRGE